MARAIPRSMRSSCSSLFLFPPPSSKRVLYPPILTGLPLFAYKEFEYIKPPSWKLELGDFTCLRRLMIRLSALWLAPFSSLAS